MLPRTLVLVLFLVLLPLLSATAASVRSPRVHELTQLKMESYLARTVDKPLLLEFYAHWCKHCKHFEPSYTEVAHELASDAVVARVDGSLYRLQAMRFRVRHFPVFYLIFQNRVFEYVGPRSPEGLVSFVKSEGLDPDLAKSHEYFVGPLAPYWRGVAALLKVTNGLYKRVRKARLTTPQAVLVAFGIIATMIAVFTVLIYFLTKPAGLAKPPVTGRPHAD